MGRSEIQKKARQDEWRVFLTWELLIRRDQCRASTFCRFQLKWKIPSSRKSSGCGILFDLNVDAEQVNKSCVEKRYRCGSGVVFVCQGVSRTKTDWPKGADARASGVAISDQRLIGHPRDGCDLMWAGVLRTGSRGG